METNQRSFHGRALRKGRCSIPGQIYLVTTVTKDRARSFEAFGRARLATRCLHDPAVTRHAETLAHVIMPDHLHWLLQLREEGDLSTAVRLFKAKVSWQIGYRVWQRGFHDRALRDQE